MKHLLDVNVLLAAIWENHSRHWDAFEWLKGRQIVLCPIAELGFLRISTNKKVFNATMTRARDLLRQFGLERKAERIADDLPALDSNTDTSEKITDQYLADLASKHGHRLATFDEAITHKAVELITHPNNNADASDSESG